MTEHPDSAREEALTELLRAADQRRSDIEDDQLRQLLSDDLVRRVFAIAWERQFDLDRSEARKDLRVAVGVAVTEVVNQSAH